MPFDISALGTSIQQFIGPYQLPAMIMGGIVLAVWMVLTYRALQVHNASEVAQIDRMLKKEKGSSHP